MDRLPSLLPAVCTYLIPPSLSLLLFADVQTFCSEKESLFVTLESFKEKGTTHLSLFYNSADKTTDPYRRAAASGLHRAGRLLRGCHGNCSSALLSWLWTLTQTAIWKAIKLNIERFWNLKHKCTSTNLWSALINVPVIDIEIVEFCTFNIFGKKKEACEVN